jgi:lipopolysaccharide biosynthesis regulator YciM
MTRDNIVFATCGLLLGLIIGSLAIGPRIAQSKLAQPHSADIGPSLTETAPPAGATATGGNPMPMVMQQLETLKQTVAKDPRNFEALVQLGNMYMDAAKFPQAADYYERALVVREEPSVRTDLGICYKQSNQLEKSLVAFHQAGEEAPDQWQARYNEAIVLSELGRNDEARNVAAKLAAAKPGDEDVKKLVAALATKK